MSSYSPVYSAGEWVYEFPGWMSVRKRDIKRWYEDMEHAHPDGCAGVQFRYAIGQTGYTLDETHYYDPVTGSWT